LRSFAQRSGRRSAMPHGVFAFLQFIARIPWRPQPLSSFQHLPNAVAMEAGCGTAPRHRWLYNMMTEPQEDE
jgi:hypothetical protein